MSYDAIAPLYSIKTNDGQESTGQRAFIVGCSQLDGYNGGNWKGCVYKIELDDEQPKITHTVQPGQGGCSDLIRLSDKLIIGAFDAGCVIPIKNFGPNKTFNCHVNGRLAKHNNQIVRLAANTDSNQFAAASIDGFVSLYSVNGEAISYTTKLSASLSAITGLCFVQEAFSADETSLVLSLQNGTICMLDIRSDQYRFNQQMTTFKSATAICSIANLNQFVVGTTDGFIVKFDLRNMCTPLQVSQVNSNRITRIKKLTDYYSKELVLGVCDLGDELNIIDFESLKRAPKSNWSCVRPETGIVRDLTQIDDKIYTCGLDSSIGCWKNVNSNA